MKKLKKPIFSVLWGGVSLTVAGLGSGCESYDYDRSARRERVYPSESRIEPVRETDYGRIKGVTSVTSHYSF